MEMFYPPDTGTPAIADPAAQALLAPIRGLGKVSEGIAGAVKDYGPMVAPSVTGTKEEAESDVLTQMVTKALTKGRADVPATPPTEGPLPQSLRPEGKLEKFFEGQAAEAAHISEGVPPNLDSEVEKAQKAPEEAYEENKKLARAGVDGTKFPTKKKTQSELIEQRLRRLQPLRDIAAGLGRAGDFTSASQILLGMPERRFGEKGELGGIDQEIALLQGLRGIQKQKELDPNYLEGQDSNSRLSQMGRMIADELGFDIPDDATFSEIQAAIPNAAALVAQREKMFYLGDVSMKQGMLRYAASEQARKVLPPAQREKLADMDNSIESMQELLRTKTQKGYNTGPLINLFEDAIKFVGLETPALSEKLAMKSELVNIAAQYRKAISGANVSKYEIRLLNQVFPQARDQDGTFYQKGLAYLRIMERVRRTYLKNLQGAEPGSQALYPTAYRYQASAEEIAALDGKPDTPIVIDYGKDKNGTPFARPGIDPVQAHEAARQAGLVENEDYVVIGR
jgi:hypothetical protein